MGRVEPLRLAGFLRAARAVVRRGSHERADRGEHAPAAGLVAEEAAAQEPAQQPVGPAPARRHGRGPEVSRRGPRRTAQPRAPQADRPPTPGPAPRRRHRRVSQVPGLRADGQRPHPRGRGQSQQTRARPRPERRRHRRDHRHRPQTHRRGPRIGPAARPHPPRPPPRPRPRPSGSPPRRPPEPSHAPGRRPPRRTAPAGFARAPRATTSSACCASPAWTPTP